ncbi:hypothetical protein B9Z55_012276 [Caenorhabditis nigoni]|nr:hypothetical protein B9Z55_012276 [Caenorhabditis nigoni]
MIFRDSETVNPEQTKGKTPKKPKKVQFSLWKLPRVVQFECIENLDVLEIIRFSILSKRAKTISKLVRWNPLNICLSPGSQPVFQSKSSINPGMIWDITYQKREEGYSYTKCITIGPSGVHRSPLIGYENAMETSKQMTEHICEVFRSPISGIEIAEESLIEWLIKIQPTIPCVTIRKNVVTSVETLYRVLNNLDVTEYFHWESIATKKEFQITEPIQSRSIAIYESSWVGLPSILNGTNSIIRLYESKLTVEDINTILKEWQMGFKLRNLEYLRIDICTLLDAEICINRAVKDLNVTLSDGNDGRPTRVKIHDEFTFKLPRVNMVRNLTRSDGMIGSLFYEYKVHQLQNLTRMHVFFQVWSQQP